MAASRDMRQRRETWTEEDEELVRVEKDAPVGRLLAWPSVPDDLVAPSSRSLGTGGWTDEAEARSERTREYKTVEVSSGVSWVQGGVSSTRP